MVCRICTVDNLVEINTGGNCRYYRHNYRITANTRINVCKRNTYFFFVLVNGNKFMNVVNTAIESSEIRTNLFTDIFFSLLFIISSNNNKVFVSKSGFN